MQALNGNLEEIMSDKLTSNSAAQIIGVSPTTVIYYNKTGKLKAERTQSGIRLFDRAEVERFAAERNTGAKRCRDARQSTGR
jgi:predicted site-specific integrase-resolvase